MTPPAMRPLGWRELFDAGRADSDSVVPYLAAAHALAGDARLIVDVGCGRGLWVDDEQRSFQDLRGEGRTVVGIDVDPDAAANPMIDEFRLIGADLRWPLDDASVDLAVSDFTLEHVADPVAFVAELVRVLRPGGALVARTVSRWSLLAFAARRVPNVRHAHVLSSLQPGREAQDVFPTAYRMNSERQLHALLDARFDWGVSHRAGLEQYLGRWPALARAVTAVEPRLPKAVRTTFVLCARKR